MRYFDPIDDEFNHQDFDKNVLRFAKIREEGEKSLWVPLLEKAFMKMQGNYQNAEGGIPQDALRLLTGAPSKTYDLEKVNLIDLWQILYSSTQ